MDEVRVADATIQHLESLYNSYCILKRNSLGENAADLSEGLFLISENIISILNEDDIYSIVCKRMGDIFEDFIYNIESDTPVILSILKDHINANLK